MKSALDRDLELADFIHYIHSSDLFISALFYLCPMFADILSVTSVCGAAFNNSSVQFLYQRRDQLRPEIVAFFGLACGYFHGNFARQCMSQCLIYPHQTIRRNLFGKIYFRFFHKFILLINYFH